MEGQSSRTILHQPIDNNMEITWKKTTDVPFSLREGQCACSHGNNMYIFGGIIQNDGEPDNLTESSDLLSFNINDFTWGLVDAKGTLPSPRSGASLVCVGNRLYLYGGLNNQDGWLNDMHCFDLDTCTWSEINGEGPKPSARDKLQGTAVDDTIFYFGGFGPKHVDDIDDWEDMDDEEEDDEVIDEEREQEAAQFGWFNDLYKFDIVTKTWSQPMHMNLGVPSPRAAHGMCTVNREIVIFGGRDIDKRTNDLHMFNVDTRKWRTDMKIKGQLPVSRSYHSVTAVDNKVVVMGGRGVNDDHLGDTHVFDTETCEWLQPKVSGDLPCKRGQHSTVTVGDKLVLFGGTSDYCTETMMTNRTFGDTYILSTGDVIKGKSIPAQTANGHGDTNGS